VTRWIALRAAQRDKPRRQVVLGAALLVLTGACGGHEIDREAWERDLAKYGETIVDWPKYESAWERVCRKDQLGLEGFVVVGLDQGREPDFIRMNIANVCPDRLPDLERALMDLTG
jgi:hypothetical protein